MSGAIEGTQEAKRRRRAMPDPLATPLPRGCLVVLIALPALCGAWVAIDPGPAPIVIGALALIVLGLAVLHFLRGRFLLAHVAAAWTPRGIRCLVIHSDSPSWAEYVATRWLARLGPQAARFNWSRRAEQRGSLEFRVFAHFCGDTRNFNPAVVVFRGLRQPQVFRFFYAFREARAGRPWYLEQFEAQMFAALGM